MLVMAEPYRLNANFKPTLISRNISRMSQNIFPPAATHRVGNRCATSKVSSSPTMTRPLDAPRSIAICKLMRICEDSAVHCGVWFGKNGLVSGYSWDNGLTLSREPNLSQFDAEWNPRYRLGHCGKADALRPREYRLEAYGTVMPIEESEFFGRNDGGIGC